MNTASYSSLQCDVLLAYHGLSYKLVSFVFVVTDHVGEQYEVCMSDDKTPFTCCSLCAHVFCKDCATVRQRVSHLNVVVETLDYDTVQFWVLGLATHVRSGTPP